ncbi:V-type ATPase subunit a family protein [Bacillus pinisoli]|uniref:V-type ATPase subunit a family protein n=1 Tax=Bacillus pinisoli TaxID=2901866 RepID=UPI001FF4618F|nr:V-type ATPase subunit a family protein [Bacillus pinisoli]
MKLLKPIEFIIVLAITILFVYDYFPNIPLAGILPEGLLITFIFGLFLFSLLYKKYRERNNEDIFKWQVFSTIYILFLMGLFTILGGQSSSGISFNNGFL